MLKIYCDTEAFHLDLPALEREGKIRIFWYFLIS